MLYFTADTHFGHMSQLTMYNRPFADVPEMNRTLVRNWNAVVGHTDTIYHLGDFTRLGLDATGWFSQLNGRIHLIPGNHDTMLAASLRRGFKLRSRSGHQVILENAIHEIILGQQLCVMCHYPISDWNGMSRGAWHLHGHVHGLGADAGRSLDVGVDAGEFHFKPISVIEVAALMDIKEIEIGPVRSKALRDYARWTSAMLEEDGAPCE